jgi:hypothetical protein
LRGELARKLLEDRAHRSAPGAEEGIGRSSGILDAGHDYASPSAFAHGRQRRGEAVEESPDVNVEGTLPGVDVETRKGRCGGTGHEKQGVEPAEGLDRGLDQVRGVVALGEVYAEDQRQRATSILLPY